MLAEVDLRFLNFYVMNLIILISFFTVRKCHRSRNLHSLWKVPKNYDRNRATELHPFPVSKIYTENFDLAGGEFRFKIKNKMPFWAA